MKIVIDGNIGSGKTTQLDLLENVGWSVRREPIDKWPLDEFYRDQRTWGYILQMAVLETQQPVIDAKCPVIYERCLFSTRDVFWRHLVKNVYPEKCIDELYQKQVERYMWYPDVYIYLSKEPEKAYEHVSKRGQAGDFGVDLDYVKELDVLYKEMILRLPCRVWIVNANKTREEIHADILQILSSTPCSKDDPVLERYSRGKKVPSRRDSRNGEVQYTPMPDVCRLS
jgi:deoxyadenosine/deoxycytidine kinase